MVNLDMSKYSIVTLEEVHSTNSYALEHLPFFDDRTVLFTSHQISGRGRYNRKWISDDSPNIYMSIILKPQNVETFPFPNLTQYLSVVLCDVLEKDFNLKPQIKWPNDILIDGSKISGILAESSMKNNKINGVVLGLGLNVNMKKETLLSIDQNATSLFALKNTNFDVDDVLRLICDKFFENYDEFSKKGFKFIKQNYINRCGFLGKNITVREANEKKQYFAKSIDDNGLLIVNDEYNNECKIITGDVLC